MNVAGFKKLNAFIRVSTSQEALFEDSPFHRPSCERVSAPPPAVGVTTLGLFDYPFLAAHWLTVGCKNAEPCAGFCRTVLGTSGGCPECLVTADLKLGVLCGENMSQQLHQSPHCNRSFTNKNHLEQHLLTQADDHPYKCNHCGSSFAQKVTLMHHFRTHKGEHPYKCDHCDSRFSEKGQLNRHLRIRTGERPYKCDHCDSSFAQKAHLDQHLRIHTGERPYKCDHCDSSFALKSTLVQHLRTHTGEHPYKCDHCGSGFCQRGHLNQHLIHTGERPYKCDHCDGSFSRKSYLDQHLRTHTGGPESGEKSNYRTKSHSDQAE
ncbi:hypothetical protein V5799_000335 [Amblyomma americanum]|uniref:C2H2-type domain-containing protein n=1 Tax=Amblyomma americanum TaxID=6943 RepID=A0AAQ4D3C3_AMBAM